jgi:hypothetical protein
VHYLRATFETQAYSAVWTTVYNLFFRKYLQRTVYSHCEFAFLNAGGILSPKWRYGGGFIVVLSGHVYMYVT